MSEEPLHEVILKVVYQSSPDRPELNSTDDIFWKIEDPYLTQVKVREVLEWLVMQGDMNKDLGKYTLSRPKFFELKKKFDSPPPPLPEEIIEPPVQQKVALNEQPLPKSPPPTLIVETIPQEFQIDEVPEAPESTPQKSPPAQPEPEVSISQANDLPSGIPGQKTSQALFWGQVGLCLLAGFSILTSALGDKLTQSFLLGGLILQTVLTAILFRRSNSSIPKG